MKRSHGRLAGASLVQGYYRIVSPLSIDMFIHMSCDYEKSSRKGRFKMKIKTASHTRQQLVNKATFWSETPLQLNAVVANKCMLMEKSSRSIVGAQSVRSNAVCPQVASSVPVNFLMALSGRPGNFFRFMQNFEETFLKYDEYVNLIIAYFPSEVDQTNTEVDVEAALQDALNLPHPDMKPIQYEDEHWIKSNMSFMQKKYPESKVRLLIMDKTLSFSRGIGLQRAADHVANEKEILFFCDVDLVFKKKILKNIRRNTVLGKQVYYPVFFSQYDPSIVHTGEKSSQYFRYEELDGYWRSFSYGMVSMFKHDFAKTRGFDLSIIGWGLEDLHLVSLDGFYPGSNVTKGYSVFPNLFNPRSLFQPV